MVKRNVRDGLWHPKFIICKRVHLRAHGAPGGARRRVWFTTVDRRYVGSGVWYYREPAPTGVADEPGVLTNLKAPLAVYGCAASVMIFIGLAIYGAISLIGMW